MRFAVTKRLPQSAVFAVLPKHQNFLRSLGHFCRLPDGLLRSVRPFGVREGIASQQNRYAPPSSVHAKTRTSALTFRHCPSRVPEDACHRRLAPPRVFTNPPGYPEVPHLPDSLVRPHPVLRVSRWDVSLQFCRPRGVPAALSSTRSSRRPRFIMKSMPRAYDNRISQTAKAKARMPTNRTPTTPPPEQRADPAHRPLKHTPPGPCPLCRRACRSPRGYLERKQRRTVPPYVPA